MTQYTLEDELKGSIQYFLDYTNFNEKSKGYGMTLDNSSNHQMSSLAASGFMLASLVSAIDYQLISYEEGKEKAYRSLKNIYEQVAHHKGMLCHFAEFKTARRLKKCEFSTIDTALFLGGALIVDAYFQDEKITAVVSHFLQRIDWNYYLGEYQGKKVVRMAYNDYNHKLHRPYQNEEEKFIFQWHMYAEQLMMYLLIAGDDRISKEVAVDLFNGFRKDVKEEASEPFVRCPTGSLFTYQFSHCFFDFKQYLDGNGFDWFENSRRACLDNYRYCQNNANYKTFQENLWGVSASNGPFGYRGFGIPPYDYDEQISYDEKKHLNGTIAPYSVVSSLPFIPEIAEQTLRIFNEKYPDLIGKYGYKDAINLDEDWIADNYYGIDKGAGLMMIENFRNQRFWKLFTNHPWICKGIEKLDFKKRK